MRRTLAKVPLAAAASIAALLLSTALTGALPATAAVAVTAESSPIGYGAGTTGGGGTPPTTVNSLSAFESAVASDNPKVVRVSGMISLSGQIDVGSNTTVLGVGANSGFIGGGLRVKESTNVIIRNLKIGLAAGTDAISLQKSTRIWVDHNDLYSDLDHDKDFYDGLLDVSHAADNITVSWNKFHDHYKVSLVGHSDNNAAEDIGHLKVTYSHNWFSNVNSRMPSLRFGTGHIYNNYYQNITDSAINSRMNAQVLVENNVFRDTALAVTTDQDSDLEGFAVLHGNDLGGAPTEITQIGTLNSPPYSYTLDPVSTVIATVTTGAGTGKVG